MGLEIDSKYVAGAMDQLFELQSLTEVGAWVAHQADNMEDDDPNKEKLRSCLGYYIRAIGRCADTAIEVLDKVETNLAINQRKG